MASLFRVLLFRIVVRAIITLVSGVSAKLSIVQRRAIGEHDLVQAPRGVTVLGGVKGDGDQIPRRQGTLAPTDQLERLGASRFAAPMHTIALAILPIEIDPPVRIPPHE